ncbi:cysteine dioxygenase [Corallococcus terminator]
MRSLLGWPLPERRESVPSLAWLVERLRDSRPDWGLLRSFVEFDEARYVRKTLAKTEACELLLVCWGPGQGSLVHDHGGSSGVSLMVRGAVRETRYVWGGDRLLPEVGVRAEEGDLMIEEPDTIHRVLNTSRYGAVSLHLYAPPMEGMTPYDDQVVTLTPPRPAGAAAGRRRRPRAG